MLASRSVVCAALLQCSASAGSTYEAKTNQGRESTAACMVGVSNPSYRSLAFDEIANRAAIDVNGQHVRVVGQLVIQKEYQVLLGPSGNRLGVWLEFATEDLRRDAIRFFNRTQVGIEGTIDVTEHGHSDNWPLAITEIKSVKAVELPR